ncbi:MAG: response regulator [Treponema sp.]|nr:response regulator [Treponema sp.]
MYNVLACDDEQIAIDSIKFIFEKNFQGQVNLFTALSGFEALNIVKQNDIDIIFMDINMPGMNGLETISLITQMKPDTVIIVLSAFDTFQYAQEALNLGAFRYITKPVNRNTVIQTARSAMNQIDSRNGNPDENEVIQKKLNSVSPMVESDFFYSCAFGTENEDLSPYLKYFDIMDRNYVFTAVEIPDLTEENRRDIHSSIRQIASENQKCIMGSFMSNRVILLFPFEKESFFTEKVHDILSTIHTLFTIKINRKIKTGVSSVCSKEIQFKEFYNQAFVALNKSSESQSIVFFEDIVSSVDKSETLQNTTERFYKRLKIGDIEGVQFLTGMYLKSLEESSASPDKWKFQAIEFIVNTKSIAKELYEDFDDSSFENSFSVISAATSINDISDFIMARAVEAVTAISKTKKETENPLITKVRTYINMHLSSDFSLEDAALYAGVSSFYLSKLFKEEMNDTFVNYVTELKMEKAAHLLRETDMSIKEITNATGYNDQNYFSKIFKNKYEMSPSEYRKFENGRV